MGALLGWGVLHQLFGADSLFTRRKCQSSKSHLRVQALGSAAAGGAALVGGGSGARLPSWCQILPQCRVLDPAVAATSACARSENWAKGEPQNRREEEL
mmetsp:Transcript_77370/g.169310  ORF Transcript_77370/g.169310 Transcript_77370/m.169310 type:complete len:99 (-) Transcript_77370:1034-1330(-)